MHQHDYQRPERIGMPEAVLSSAKTDQQLASIVDDLLAQPDPVLFTRLAAKQFDTLDGYAQAKMDYDPVSLTATIPPGWCAMPLTWYPPNSSPRPHWITSLPKMVPGCAAPGGQH